MSHRQQQLTILKTNEKAEGSSYDPEIDVSICGRWDREVNHQTNLKNSHQFEIDKFLLKTNNFILFVEQLT
ncbi:unnamed protein product, partial [Ceratitis capitata]